MNENVQLLDKLQEQVQYKNKEFPLVMFCDVFDNFVDNSFYCHWHDEIELQIVLRGSVKYLLNQTAYVVEEGNGLFIGSRILHSARQMTGGSVAFNILFPTTILSRLFHNLSFHKYTSPSWNWSHMKYLDKDVPEEYEILSSLRKIEESVLSQSSELAHTEAILHIWQYLPMILDHMPAGTFEPCHQIREERMRNMISYIHDNYMQHITAASIAASANISRSECFRCFALFGETSPVDYLNKYRLHIAAKRLLDTNESISDISHACGFSSTSYFSKTFKDNYEHSPLSFRKRGGVTLS
ncbi:MAG: AraC family transcriptional regulator [Lachnospiraceae bacterium]|jgi:AraC-like DNA-binding protein|nr:AraC family transcriptional regulator [Lachnospiraceae bacterium]